MQRCPACGDEAPAGDFLAGLCGRCFSEGRPIPIGETAPLTTRELVRLGGSRTPVQQIRDEKEAGMERKACPKCGRGFLPAGYSKHVPACRANAKGGDGRSSGGVIGEPGREIVAAPRAERPQAHGGNGQVCGLCPLHGNAGEQDLFVQLVRGGLGLQEAVARMEQAKQVYSR